MDFGTTHIQSKHVFEWCGRSPDFFPSLPLEVGSFSPRFWFRDGLTGQFNGSTYSWNWMMGTFPGNPNQFDAKSHGFRLRFPQQTNPLAPLVPRKTMRTVGTAFRGRWWERWDSNGSLGQLHCERAQQRRWTQHPLGGMKASFFPWLVQKFKEITAAWQVWSHFWSGGGAQ